jgi:hypothetical protein
VIVRSSEAAWTLVSARRHSPRHLVASHLFRHDPLGVPVPSGHRFAAMDAVPVATLAAEPLLLAEQARAPEFNQFTIEMCQAAGFAPTLYEGTVESIRAAADLVTQGRCLYCVPSSCIAALPATIWRPLTGQPPTTPGRYCGAPATTPTTSKPSSTARAPCRRSWAG